jgi:hypothetical protein
MNRLPEPELRQPPAKQAGQPDVDRTVDQLVNAVDQALLARAPYVVPTSFRDETKTPKIGNAMPVAQPGRPPMSQRAVDLNTTMLAGGATFTMVGGTVSVVMYVSQWADPAVCGIVFGSLVALPLALGRLMRRTKEVVEAAPATHNHFYEAPVTNVTVENHTKGIIATNRNELPK